MNKIWQPPSKLTERRETVGNQATMVQCLLCIVRDRYSLWEKEGGAPDPRKISKLKLKDGVGISRCRGEGWHPTQRALHEYRQEKPPWYRLGNPDINPSLCCRAVELEG